jgi:hypothetical protein
MQLFDPNNPNEKKKILAAAVLGLIAVFILGYVFLGGGSSKLPVNQRASATPTPSKKSVNQSVDESAPDSSVFQPVSYSGSVPSLSETKRNIFAYYEPPPPTPKPVIIPTPSPTPPPPVTVTSLSPSNVYARTPDNFALQVAGDKFTPALHIILDGRDLPTRFINSQQLATTVPASMIANPGSRQVMVRSNDGKLYSNATTLTVTAPPQPNYTYIGIIGKRTFNDTAILLDKSTKEVLNVQRGDVIGTRFRVNSISEREIVLVDTILKVRSTIAFSTEASPNKPSRPPVRVADEEPGR